jgi:NADH:ubiquinone oxidoreductase subunit E
VKKLEPKPYDVHVLVCEGKDCAKAGAKDLAKGVRKALHAEGVAVRVSRTACQDLCKHACVVGYEGPRGRWWGRAGPDDAGKLARKIATRCAREEERGG